MRLKITFEPTHMQQIHYQVPTLKMTLPNSFKVVKDGNSDFSSSSQTERQSTLSRCRQEQQIGVLSL